MPCRGSRCRTGFDFSTHCLALPQVLPEAEILGAYDGAVKDCGMGGASRGEGQPPLGLEPSKGWTTASMVVLFRNAT